MCLMIKVCKLLRCHRFHKKNFTLIHLWQDVKVSDGVLSYLRKAAGLFELCRFTWLVSCQPLSHCFDCFTKLKHLYIKCCLPQAADLLPIKCYFVFDRWFSQKGEGKGIQADVGGKERAGESCWSVREHCAYLWENAQNLCQKVLTYCNQICAETPAAQI